MSETEVEQLLSRFGVIFANRSHGKRTSKTITITLDGLTEAINQATQPLRIITTGTGYFKPGLKGMIVAGGEREVVLGTVPYPELKMTIPEFTIELDNGDRREFCQYGRDFRFDVCDFRFNV